MKKTVQEPSPGLPIAAHARQVGLIPLPLRDRSKEPAKRGWNKTEPQEYAQLERDFERVLNVGVLLGKGHVDVDLDAVAILGMAPRFLPETPMVWGRAG